MNQLIKRSAQSFLQLFYPHHCLGCGADHIHKNEHLCGKCIHFLPDTGFFRDPRNPVERCFDGRLPIQAAAARYYFTKDSLIQQLLFALKYKGNKDAGLFLGRMMGYSLKESERFQEIDLIVPLPLNRIKEFKRGYNQAAVICQGIQDVWFKPVLTDVVIRKRFTETQTRQNRIARWQNMEGVFEVTQPKKIIQKHILLVDDVITTGATLEACGSYILSVTGTRLSIAAAAYTI